MTEAKMMCANCGTPIPDDKPFPKGCNNHCPDWAERQRKAFSDDPKERWEALMKSPMGRMVAARILNRDRK
jgi:hypothetical protein